jgi:two-component system, NarL family, response regulator NreC
VVPALRSCFPQRSIVVLTDAGHPSLVQATLAAGASGYLLLTAREEDLFTGIRAVASGETYLQPSLGVELARWESPRDTAGLTPTEEAVVRLLTLGHTNAEVATLTGLGLRTIEAHRSRIQKKLGLRTRAELVRFVREAGILSASDSTSGRRE